MRMFQFDPAPYAAEFAARGFVHIPKGVTEGFYELLTRQVEEYLQTHQIKNYHIGDKKQAVYQLPEGDRYHRELLESIGAVCGLDPDDLALSERHIKVYDQTAIPNPLAHKDRFASQISVGISVHVPEGSTLVLYPYDQLEVNPFNSSTEYRASLTPHRVPEPELERARRVEIADGPRDVVMFRGNSTWHLRARPAGTTMVYLKLNAWNCDPLGEDPQTPERRETTLRLLDGPDEELAELIPMIGRRVDYVQRRYNRNWEEVIGVVLWGQPHSTIDEREFQVLRAIDGLSPVRSVLRAALNGSMGGASFDLVRGLARRGIVDLVPAGREADGDARRAAPELVAPISAVPA